MKLKVWMNDEYILVRRILSNCINFVSSELIKLAILYVKLRLDYLLRLTQMNLSNTIVNVVNIN